MVGGYDAKYSPSRTAFAYDGNQLTRLPTLPKKMKSSCVAVIDEFRVVNTGGQNDQKLKEYTDAVSMYHLDGEQQVIRTINAYVFMYVV